MHVLTTHVRTQDFEALTPNLLARTVETVEGGGIVVLLISSLTSLSQLYSLTMDVHSRLRTESHQEVTGALRDGAGGVCVCFWWWGGDGGQHELLRVAGAWARLTPPCPVGRSCRHVQCEQPTPKNKHAPDPRAGRFNERLVLSLANCPSCVLLDDELNILPTSTLVQRIAPVQLDADGLPLDKGGSAAARRELSGLQASLADTQPAGSLVGRCCTLDQARAVVTFLDAASERTLRSTVALTAARGRGKSAALGLAIAGALALGYSNIFVTAPSPENLRTLFEFVFKGLDALGCVHARVRACLEVCVHLAGDLGRARVKPGLHGALAAALG